MAEERVVLDTSLFVNPEVRGCLGPTPTDALLAFVDIARRAAPQMEFYMPPSIFEELLNFVRRDELSDEVLVYLRQKSPRRLELTVPGQLLYELVEDMRERVNKGLRIAEGAVRSTADQTEVIKDLRRKYRDALREGILDSSEDVDLILLAYELGGLLVTADQGACAWADRLGVRWLFPERFVDFVEASIREHKIAQVD